MKNMTMALMAAAAMMGATALAQCPDKAEKKAACKCEACGCTAEAKKADCKCEACGCTAEAKKADCKCDKCACTKKAACDMNKCAKTKRCCPK